MIDDRLQLRTPEGALLDLIPAGPLPRAFAWLIDLLIRSLVYLALLFLVMPAGIAGWGLLLLAVFLLEWFYPVLFELLWQGQTPGKRAIGLRVILDNGLPVSPAASLLRNLLRSADMFPSFYLLGFLSMLISRHWQRLGDLAAGTLVVHEPAPAARLAADESGVSSPPDWPLSSADRQLLLDYLERGKRLSAARRAELASLAFPELPAQQAEQQLRAVARGVLGDS